MRAVSIAIAALVLVVVGLLIAVEADAPLGGLTHSQAVAMARDAIHEGDVAERWALPGPFLLFRGGSTDAVSPWRRIVWAVSFVGTFPPASCGPIPPPGQPPRCPPANHTVVVIIDYRTGEFIQADYEP